MRTIVLIDGQNLYYLARIAWAPFPADPSSPDAWPSYDIKALASRLTARLPQRNLDEIRFYTGVPAATVDRFWHSFWTNKCRHLRNQGVHVCTGRVNSTRQEKGVDVSLALDLIQATHEQRYDAAIIESQDANFGPAVRLAKKIAYSQGRYLQFESAFPRRCREHLQTRRARHDVGPHRQGHLRRLPGPTRLPTPVTCTSGGHRRRRTGVHPVNGNPRARRRLGVGGAGSPATVRGLRFRAADRRDRRRGPSRSRYHPRRRHHRRRRPTRITRQHS